MPLNTESQCMNFELQQESRIQSNASIESHMVSQWQCFMQLGVQWSVPLGIVYNTGVQLPPPPKKTVEKPRYILRLDHCQSWFPPHYYKYHRHKTNRTRQDSVDSTMGSSFKMTPGIIKVGSSKGCFSTPLLWGGWSVITANTPLKLDCTMTLPRQSELIL